MSSETIRALQAWYVQQCNGDWEHQYGVAINAIDNPGWSVKIDLMGTSLENRPFDGARDDYDSETNWLMCRRTPSQFEAACGPERLVDVLQIFLDWSESSDKPIQTDDPSGRS